MKKELLVAFSFGTLVLSSDIMASTPMPVCELKPFQQTVLPFQICDSTGVEIKNKATQENESNKFCLERCGGELCITLIGDEEFGKTFEIWLNSKKVGEIIVPSDNQISFGTFSDDNSDDETPLCKTSLFPKTEKAVSRVHKESLRNN